jgi:uncharacterized membrane protein
MRYRQTIALLALVGLFVALYLWLHALGFGGPIKCGTGSCETVQTSQWSVLLVALATIGVLFTAYLTYLELFVIHAICRWCVGSAVIIAAIWVVSVIAMRRKEGMTER